LGVAFIELGPLTAPLTDISGNGITQKIRFLRKKKNKEQKVGICVVNLKLIGEEDIPINEYDQQHGQNIFDLNQRLPGGLHKTNFQWRLRIDVRHGVDIPLNYKS